MAIAGFLLQDKLNRIWFFEETFFLVNTSMKIVLGMLFFTFSGADIWFTEKKLIWRSYMTTKALPITQKIELINKHKFAKTALDKAFKTFVVYVVALEIPSGMTIHSSWAVQVL